MALKRQSGVFGTPWGAKNFGFDFKKEHLKKITIYKYNNEYKPPETILGQVIAHWSRLTSEAWLSVRIKPGNTLFEANFVMNLSKKFK